jgi:hypothetical protein
MADYTTLLYFLERLCSSSRVCLIDDLVDIREVAVRKKRKKRVP